MLDQPTLLIWGPHITLSNSYPFSCTVLHQQKTGPDIFTSRHFGKCFKFRNGQVVSLMHPRLVVGLPLGIDFRHADVCTAVRLYQMLRLPCLYSVTRSLSVLTRPTTRRWGWLLGRRGYIALKGHHFTSPWAPNSFVHVYYFLSEFRFRYRF
jgi:hypothetical protein